MLKQSLVTILVLSMLIGAGCLEQFSSESAAYDRGYVDGINHCLEVTSDDYDPTYRQQQAYNNHEDRNVFPHTMDHPIYPCNYSEINGSGDIVDWYYINNSGDVVIVQLANFPHDWIFISEYTQGDN